jgi:aminomethyltransferase
LAEDRFLLCVNASNIEKDYQWIVHQLEGKAEAIDQSTAYAQIALQGPRSIEVLQNLTPSCLRLLKNYWFVEGMVDGVPAIISRTGYTGEDGFELYFLPEFATQIWERLMTEGKKAGIQPVGLGARDTLRLEMGFPLYGHELNETTTPIEAGLKRFIDFNNRRFIGRESLIQQMTEGIQRKLVGFKMLGEGIPRAHYEIHKNGRKIGEVTSGTMSPTLRKGVGLGYVRVEDAWEGNEISLMIRRKMFPVEIVRIPIYKKSLTPICQIGKGRYHGIAFQENSAH